MVKKEEEEEEEEERESKKSEKVRRVCMYVCVCECVCMCVCGNMKGGNVCVERGEEREREEGEGRCVWWKHGSSEEDGGAAACSPWKGVCVRVKPHAAVS